MFSVRPLPRANALMMKVPRRLRIVTVALVLGVAFVALSGCQVKVAVETRVNRDGSGVLQVGVGLDDKAVSRVGNLETDIATDDLVATGWAVSPPQKEADGLTWIRASKPFRDGAELAAVMNEVTGSAGLFRDFAFQRTETDSETTYELKGVVDATKGIDSFIDPELTAQLGDPFGGNIQAIEAEEGKSIADMVGLEMTAAVVDGPPKRYQASLRDTQVVAIDVSTVEAKPPPVAVRIALAAAGGCAVLLLIVMLVGARRRFARRY